MTERKRRKRKRRRGAAGIAIYVRCRFCGSEFTGNSDKVFNEWSAHLVLCEKEHNEKAEKK